MKTILISLLFITWPLGTFAMDTTIGVEKDNIVEDPATKNALIDPNINVIKTPADKAKKVITVPNSASTTTSNPGMNTGTTKTIVPAE